MFLLCNETTKYEVSFRRGNEIVRKEFASRAKAVEYANSFGVQYGAKWVVLTTMEKIL